MTDCNHNFVSPGNQLSSGWCVMQRQLNVQ